MNGFGRFDVEAVGSLEKVILLQGGKVNLDQKHPFEFAYLYVVSVSYPCTYG